jgi:hypothetical protein
MTYTPDESEKRVIASPDTRRMAAIMGVTLVARPKWKPAMQKGSPYDR